MQNQLITKLAAFGMSCCFLLSQFLSLAVCTPSGVHCPTAPIQAVKVVGKSCCAVEVRKPKLGEKGFQQCRCAEKSVAKKKASTQSTNLYFVASRTPVYPVALPDGLPSAGLDARWPSALRRQLTPPPNC